MDARRTELPNINFITCSNVEIYRVHAPKIDPLPMFTKSLIDKRTINIWYMDARRT